MCFGLNKSTLDISTCYRDDMAVVICCCLIWRLFWYMKESNTGLMLLLTPVASALI